jgi:hypothetical protein
LNIKHDKQLRLNIVQARDASGSWSEVYAQYPDMKPHAIRAIYYREKRRQDVAPTVEGATADDLIVNEEEAWEKAVEMSRKRKKHEAKRAARAISFDCGPICVVNMADFHAGSDGTDYERIADEIDIVNDTPGMFFGFAGDMVDNFIVGRLQRIQRDSSFQVNEQWAVLKYLLRKVSSRDKLLWSVAGNHDNWTPAMAGIDYFAELHAGLTKNVIVDSGQADIAVTVGGTTRNWRIRHKWKGNSQWNSLHAISKAGKFNNSRPFDVGVGAHTHRSGLSGYYEVGDITCVAVLCGAYKRYDDYAIELGLSEMNNSTGVPVVQDEDGNFVLFPTIESAANYMSVMYSGD